MIDMQDEKLNADMKRALRGAFAAKNVLDFDDEVDKQVKALKARIQEDGTVSLMDVLSQYQVDFFSKIAFGQTSNFLEERTPTTPWSSNDRLMHWQIFQGIPVIEAWLCQSWLSMVWRIWRKQTEASEWMKYAINAIQTREADIEKSGNVAGHRNDLLDRYLQARTTHPHLVDDQSLLRLVSSTVSAGFDSTPHTMNSIIIFLCKHPDAYAKLKQEIMEAHQRGNLSEVPKWTEVNKLPYLDAVMKESMRLYPFLNILLERQVPETGTNINGHFLPRGTTVGCHSTLVGCNKDFYGANANDFCPERWFSANRIPMERSSMVFGSGKRMCIGLHIAELEIKKTIPVIVRDFDVSDSMAHCEEVTDSPMLDEACRARSRTDVG